MIRIIPRLDIKGPNLIKGVQFEGNRVLGTAWEFARRYYEAGADELFYQDCVASLYRRNGLLEIVRATSAECFIPLTVAGGVRSLEDVRQLLLAGADKVAINTAAVERPELIREAALEFGSQCIVSAIEAYRYNDRYQAWVNYGRDRTELDVFEWADRVVELGAGEIFLSSINRDGMGSGFDLELVKRVSCRVPIPVIACGGAGSRQHLLEAIKSGSADAVSAASLFHYFYAQPVTSPTMTFADKRLRMGEATDSGNVDFLNHGYGGVRATFVEPTSLADTKKYLFEQGIPVRMDANL